MRTKRRGPFGVAATMLLLPLVIGIAASAPRTHHAGSASPDEAPPSDCETAEHRQFDFWLGHWDVHNRQANPGTPENETLYDTGKATAHIHSALGGCAVVEHWEGRLVPDRHVLGFSLRAWNPETERWHVLLNWPGPGAPSFFEIDGAFRDDLADFVFRGRRGFVRYRFADTRGDEPRWVGARADGRNGPWAPFWIMRFSRRDGPTGEHRHGASLTTSRCPDDAFRGTDFLVGDWVGDEIVVRDDEERRRPLRIRSWSILEGCAIVDRVSIGGEESGFYVRSFLPQEDAWVQYSLERDDLRLVRWEGEAPTDDSVVLRTVEPRADSPGRFNRMSWSREGDRLIRKVDVSFDGGETWRTTARAELSRE